MSILIELNYTTQFKIRTFFSANSRNGYSLNTVQTLTYAQKNNETMNAL